MNAVAEDCPRKPLAPPDRADILALLADWPTDGPWVAVNKRWIVSRDGRIWEYYPRGSNKIPDDPRSGIWSDHRLLAWTGHYRRTPDGQYRKCTIAVPLRPEVVPAELLLAKSLFRPDDADKERQLWTSYQPEMIERRRLGKLEDMAAEGVQAALALGG